MIRKESLTIISHLVLNDMIRIKEEVADIMMLMDDDDQSIVDQVKLFFTELQMKQANVIYN